MGFLAVKSRPSYRSTGFIAFYLFLRYLKLDLLMLSEFQKKFRYEKSKRIEIEYYELSFEADDDDDKVSFLYFEVTLVEFNFTNCGLKG